MDYKVGDFYYYYEYLCEILNIADIEGEKNILIGLPEKSNPAIGTKVLGKYISSYHFDFDRKGYKAFSYFPMDEADKRYLTPAFQRVKKNRLSTKLYPNAKVSDCGNFIDIPIGG